MTMTIKRILILISLPIGLFFFAFLGLVGWYTWQLTQGTTESKINIISQFDSAAFTALENTAKQARVIENYEVYIRPHNPRFGTPNAPITIIAFIDFECPFCRQAFPEFEAIRDKYSPIVEVVFKHFPLSSIHPNALPAATAAQCANEQNLFWEYYHELFKSSVLSDTAYSTYANRIGVQQQLFTRCQTLAQTEQHIMQDFQDGVTIGVRGTPTYIVNGSVIEGVLTTSDWDTIILELLNQTNQ